MASLLLAAAFGAAVRATALESTIAQPTDASVTLQTVKVPQVTEPPNPSAVRELLRRAEVQTVLVGPDNTCGYVSGLLGAAYTCGNTAGSCAFITTSTYGVVACCDDLSCDFRTDCRDRAQISAGDCDNGCMNDIYTAKCTAASLPYCGTIRFFGSVTDYFCHSLSYSTPMDATTTWLGETDGRSFTAVAVTLTSDSTSRKTTVSSATGGLGSSTRSSSGSSTTSDGSSSGSSSSDSSGSSSSSGASTSNKGSSTPVGAIVGGVVGGVALLALIAFGIWFLVRRSKKNQAATAAPVAAAAAYPPMQQAPPPGGPSPGPPMGGQQPIYNQQYPPQYPNPQGYQQPQGAAYFPNQEKPAEQYVVGQAPVQPTSPMSQATDPRYSMQPSSPTSTLQSFQPQHTGGTFQTQAPTVPSTVYEAGGDAIGNQGHNTNHHGQFHEMG